jgi:hypothetical protein
MGPHKGVSRTPSRVDSEATLEPTAESAGERLVGIGNQAGRKLVRDVITQHGNDQDENAIGEND